MTISLFNSYFSSSSKIHCSRLFSISVVDAQQVSKNTLFALTNEDYSISVDINSYQSFLEQPLSKMDVSIGWM